MKTQKIMAILLAFAAATACGRQLVEFPEPDAAAFADTTVDSGNLDTQPLDAGSDIVAGTDVAQTDVAQTDIAAGTDVTEETDVADSDIAVGTDVVEGTDIVVLDIGTDAGEGTDVVVLDIGTDAVEGTDVVTLDIGTDAAVGTDAEASDIAVGTDTVAVDTLDLDAIGDLGTLPDLGDAEAADIAPLDIVLLPIAPTVIDFTPVDGAQGITTTVQIAVVFGIPMDPHSLDELTFTVSQGVTPVLGQFLYLPLVNTLVFTPDVPLLVDLAYDVTITTGALSLEGTPMAEAVTWTFSTEDFAPPEVLSTTPGDGANNVNINSHLSIFFSKPMDPLSIDENSVIVMQGLNSITGQVTYDELTWIATFVPDAPLVVGLSYDASVTVAAMDTHGIPMAQDHTWTFSTDACGLEPLTFTQLKTVAVLGSTTVTNSGPTIITGNLRLFPGPSIVGFPPGEVVQGAITSATPNDDLARGDLLQAYDDAQGRSLCPKSAEGNLGGSTLSPGLYKGVKMSITSGVLTLDGQGDPNAVFIFQTSETFITTTGMSMVLINGANPDRIYWAVGSSATFGDNSVIYGNVLAHVSISMNTGASIVGRLLAYTGAVTLLSNTVTMPQ
jgi:hypothetical protein